MEITKVEMIYSFLSEFDSKMPKTKATVENAFTAIDNIGIEKLVLLLKVSATLAKPIFEAVMYFQGKN